MATREQDVFDALLREDFGFFLRYALKEVSPSERYIHNFHIDAITHQLGRVQHGENTRLIVTIPPRMLKSFTISSAWVAWMLGKNPALRFLTVSYGQDLADKLARDCLQIMVSPWFQRIFPNLRFKKKSNSDFETTLGGGRFTTSVGGVMTGRGADIIIIDDPSKADEVLSPVQREALKVWMFNTAMQRLNNLETGSIILVMQRLHIADLAGEMIDLGGWHELKLPAIATRDERVEIGPNRYHLWRAGEALHPERLSLARLAEKKKQDPFAFAAQFMQDPVPLHGNLVDPAWLQYYDALPSDGLVVSSWDTASKAGVLNDYTVGITALYHNGRYYILNVFRERAGFPRLRAALDTTCSTYGVQRLLIEHASSGLQLIDMLRDKKAPATPLPIACIPDQDKLTRFHAQVYHIEQGAVVLPRSAPWLAEFITEIIGFPNARHDDQADALAQMLRFPPRELDTTFGAPELYISDGTSVYRYDPDDDDIDDYDEDGEPRSENVFRIRPNDPD